MRGEALSGRAASGITSDLGNRQPLGTRTEVNAWPARNSGVFAGTGPTRSVSPQRRSALGDDQIRVALAALWATDERSRANAAAGQPRRCTSRPVALGLAAESSRRSSIDSVSWRASTAIAQGKHRPVFQVTVSGCIDAEALSCSGSGPSAAVEPARALAGGAGGDRSEPERRHVAARVFQHVKAADASPGHLAACHGGDARHVYGGDAHFRDSRPSREVLGDYARLLQATCAERPWCETISSGTR